MKYGYIDKRIIHTLGVISSHNIRIPYNLKLTNCLFLKNSTWCFWTAAGVFGLQLTISNQIRELEPWIWKYYCVCMSVCIHKDIHIHWGRGGNVYVCVCVSSPTWDLTVQLWRATELSSLLLGNKIPQNLVTEECEKQTGGHLWILVSMGLPSGCQLGPQSLEVLTRAGVSSFR